MPDLDDYISGKIGEEPPEPPQESFKTDGEAARHLIQSIDRNGCISPCESGICHCGNGSEGYKVLKEIADGAYDEH